MLNSIKIKHEELFHELDGKNQELIRELDESQCMFNTHSLWYQEEVECLKYMLEKQEAKSKEEIELLEMIHTDEINKLQKQMTNAKKKFQESQQLLKSELKVKDQEIICIQNTLSDKIMKYAELEKKMSNEQDRNENLQTSLCEFKIKYDKTQAEMTQLRTELKQNSFKLEEAEQEIQRARDEIVQRTAEFEKTVEETRQGLCTKINKLEGKNS
ncbi:MAG: hypothetical protein ACRYE7_00300, partial [Janthinobacterium lividum]